MKIITIIYDCEDYVDNIKVITIYPLVHGVDRLCHNCNIFYFLSEKQIIKTLNRTPVQCRRFDFNIDFFTLNRSMFIYIVITSHMS